MTRQALYDILEPEAPMRLRLFLSLGFLLVSALLCSARASAGLHFCNKTDKTVDIAIGIESDCFLGECYRSEGWWKAEPGECQTAVSADLNPGVDTYFYYASSADIVWSGDKDFCVDRANPFDFNTLQNENCATGDHRKFRRINGSLLDVQLDLR